MAFQITYKTLCTVNVLHSHFLDQGLIPYELRPAPDLTKVLSAYNFADIFSLIPTQESINLMKRLKVRMKVTSKGFLMIVESEKAGSDYTPRIPFPDDIRFTFSLYPKDEAFFNYTNLRLAPPPEEDDKIERPLHFSNLSDNLAGSTPMLTSKIAAFNTNESYQAGDLISATVGGEARLLEAKSNIGKIPFNIADWRIWPAELYNPGIDYLKGSLVIENDVLYQAQDDHNNTVLPVDPQPGAMGSKWKAFSGNANALALQFASYQDKLEYPIRSKKLRIDISGQNTNEVRARLRRVESYDSNAGKQLITEDFETEDGANFSFLTLDYSKYPAGKYRISLKIPGGGNSFFYDKRFYLTDEFVNPRPLAIIELFHTTSSQGTNWGAFRLLDANNNLNNPSFDLRFRHRSTFWKYIFTKAQTPSDFDQLNEVSDPNDQTQFETGDLFPITKSYEEIRKLNGSGTTDLLPNPSPQFIQLTDNKIYSEIFINA